MYFCTWRLDLLDQIPHSFFEVLLNYLLRDFQGGLLEKKSLKCLLYRFQMEHCTK